MGGKVKDVFANINDTPHKTLSRTINPKNLKKIHSIGKNLGIKVIEIGHVIKGKGVFLEDHSKWLKFWYKGWDHFR